MRWLRRAWRRACGLIGYERRDDRLTEEIRFHVDQQTESGCRSGLTPDEARRQALVAFGGIEGRKEEARDEFRLTWLREWSRDLRLAARTLRRAPAFTAVTVLTLGLGIGAATAVFSVVSGVLLEPLPYPQSHRLVRLYQVGDDGQRMNVSAPNFRDWQTLTQSFAGMAETASWGTVPVLGGSEPAMGVVNLVSREFFAVMGVRPVIGRTFAPDEHRPNGTPAVVVSHRFWQRWLGADSSLAGLALTIGDRRYAVVGVMPPTFDYPIGTAVWLPRELNEVGDMHEARTAHNYEVIARVRSDVPVAAAQAEISAVSRDLKVRYGRETAMADALVVRLLDQLTAASKPVLMALFAASVILLVVANTNVSSLLLARAEVRRTELAVRMAIGAGRGRLVRQWLTEAALLCGAGAGVGAIIAVWMTRALLILGGDTAPRLDEVQLDWRALAFACTASVVSAVALTALTSLGARDVSLSSVLSEDRRTGTTGRRSLKARHALVVVQVAMTVVLLAGAALLGRSLQRLLAVDPGFTIDETLVVDFALTNGGPDFRSEKIVFLDALLERVERQPGVQRAGMTTGFPLGGGNYSNGRFLEMTSVDEFVTREQVQELSPAVIDERRGYASYRIVSDGYFEAMGIPLLRGRVFRAGDSVDAPHVAVISESLAAARWPDQNPIGRFVQFGNMDGDPTGFRVVGVVGDVRERTMEAPPGAVFYVTYRQRPNSIWSVSVVVRGPEAPGIIAPVRQIVRDLDPQLPLELRTVQTAFDRTTVGRRFSLVLVSVFAVAALVLATLGLYGLVTYLVAERTREIGIRLALGAQATDLVAAIVGKGLTLAVSGAAVGLVLSFALARFARGLLFGVSPTDPVVLAAACAVAVGAAIAASLVPAWRAARVDPVVVLRK